MCRKFNASNLRLKKQLPIPHITSENRVICKCAPYSFIGLNACVCVCLFLVSGVWFALTLAQRCTKRSGSSFRYILSVLLRFEINLSSLHTHLYFQIIIFHFKIISMIVFIGIYYYNFVMKSVKTSNCSRSINGFCVLH